jgi:hypothetical protein
MLEISSLINPSVTALSSPSEKHLQICTLICWASRLLLMLSQLLSKFPSSYCIRTTAKFAVAIPYHLAFSRFNKANTKRGAQNFGFLVQQRNLGFLCPTKKCIGGGGRESTLGSPLEATEGFAFGTAWDALGLQAKEKEQLLMIP